MPERTPREVIDAYVDAMSRADWALVRELLADDYVEEYPQSGELVRGPDKAIAVRHRDRPEEAAADGAFRSRSELVVGGEERWVLAPNFTAIRTTADGDVITSLIRATYPDGEWYVVYIGTVEHGRIRHATMVFGPMFEAPEWRRGLVERMPEADR
jgi:hypothetical protein